MALFSPRPLPDTDTESGVPAVSTPGLFLIPFREKERNFKEQQHKVDEKLKSA